MKASEFRGRDPEELRAELVQLRKQLFKLKFQWQAEENPDTSERRKVRREIARIKTILREMRLAPGEAKQAGS